MIQLHIRKSSCLLCEMYSGYIIRVGYMEMLTVKQCHRCTYQRTQMSQILNKNL